MTQTLSATQILYRSTHKVETASGTYTVGNTSPDNMYLSDAHKNARSSSKQAKINTIAVALQYLLQKRLTVTLAINSNMAYIEFEDSNSGDVFFATVTRKKGIVASWKSGLMLEITSHQAVVLLADLILGKGAVAPEAYGYFNRCLEEYATNGKVSEEAMFLFCDAYYYELFAANPSAKIDFDDLFSEEVIKQALRTGEMITPEPIRNFGIQMRDPVLEKMQEEPKTDAATAAKTDSVYDAAKNGDFRIPFTWDVNQLSYIPELSTLDNYVPDSNFFSLLNVAKAKLAKVQERMSRGEFGADAIKNDYLNTILVGKPGTGKTTLAYALAAALGMPIRTVTNSRHTEEDTFQGMTKVSESSFRFVETPFLETFKHGGIIVMEEFNLADPGVTMGALGQAIEKPFLLMEDGYKEVHRHPLCIIISTMNTETQGSIEPSEAFTSRSPRVYPMDDPTEEDFIAILMKGGHKKAECKKVHSIYRKILTFLTSPEVNEPEVARSVTLRHCIAALEELDLGTPFTEAIRTTMVGTIAIKNLDLYRQVMKAIVEPFTK